MNGQEKGFTMQTTGILLMTAMLAGVLAASDASAADPVRYDLSGAKTYSNLCRDRATRDVEGLRIIVRVQTAGPQVLVQDAEGGLPPPSPAPSAMTGGRLRFVVPAGAAAHPMTGQVFDGYVLMRGAKSGARPFKIFPRDEQGRLPACG
jgi:hypothetical protein